MGQSTPAFHDVVSAIFGRDFDPRTVHVAYFKGDPHKKDEARWHGHRLTSELHFNSNIVGAPPTDVNHFLCLGVLDPDIPGRSLANVIGHVAFWMDDVGTKTPRERVDGWIKDHGLTPTLIIETSPGNCSYLWALEHMVPADGEFYDQTVAAVRAKLKAGGWGDPATQEAARYMRSGFGVNGKESYRQADGSPFPVKIVEFNPIARQPIQAFARAIMGENWRDEVASGKYLTSAQLVAQGGGGSNERNATMDMPLVKLAGAVGLDPTPSTRAGVIDCHCPNEAAHTGGDPTGYAIINDGMSFCNHASCQHLRSPDFVDLMVERYDQQIEAGLMFGSIIENPFGPGLLDAKTGERVPPNGQALLARERFAGVGLDGQDVGEAGVADLKGEAEALASRQRDHDEAKNAKRAGLFDRFIYVKAPEMFFDRELGDLITPAKLDKEDDVIEVFGYRTSGDKRGSVQMLNDLANLVRVETTAVVPYRADLKPGTDLVQVPGKKGLVSAVNTFVPTSIGFRPGVPQVWLDHIDFLYGDQPVVKEYLLDYMAFCVQHPEVKMSVIPLIAGAPGVGKDGALLQPFFKLLGLHNVRAISTHQLANDFNDFLTSPVIHMGEFSLAGVDGSKAYDRLKDMTSPNPVPVTINPKYGKTYRIEVAPKFIATTNNDDAVEHVPPEDRRFFVARSNAEPKHGGGQGSGPGTDPYYTKLHSWVRDEANLETIHHWLMNRRITVFDPNKAPPRTQARHEVLVSSLGSVSSFVYELVTNGPLAGRKVLSFKEVEARALASDNPNVRGKVFPKALAAGLSAAGCRKIERVTINGERVQLWTGACITMGDGKTIEGSALTVSERDHLLSHPQDRVATYQAEQKALQESLLAA